MNTCSVSVSSMINEREVQNGGVRETGHSFFTPRFAFERGSFQCNSNFSCGVARGPNLGLDNFPGLDNFREGAPATPRGPPKGQAKDQT